MYFKTNKKNVTINSAHHTEYKHLMIYWCLKLISTVVEGLHLPPQMKNDPDTWYTF